jgi:hypothetical protein
LIAHEIILPVVSAIQNRHFRRVQREPRSIPDIAFEPGYVTGEPKSCRYSIAVRGHILCADPRASGRYRVGRIPRARTLTPGALAYRGARCRRRRGFRASRIAHDAGCSAARSSVPGSWRAAA